jgi:hypothetical protein
MYIYIYLHSVTYYNVHDNYQDINYILWPILCKRTHIYQINLQKIMIKYDYLRDLLYFIFKSFLKLNRLILILSSNYS